MLPFLKLRRAGLARLMLGWDGEWGRHTRTTKESRARHQAVVLTSIILFGTTLLGIVPEAALKVWIESR